MKDETAGKAVKFRLCNQVSVVKMENMQDRKRCDEMTEMLYSTYD